MTDDNLTDDGSNNAYGISTYALTLALLAFFSTTIDDFCVLIIFFSRALKESEDAPEKLNWDFVKISVGQTIGFTIIVAISLIGLILGLFFPEDYIALIGFVPILIGTWKLYEVVDEDCCDHAIYKFCCCVHEDDEVECTASIHDGDVGEKQSLLPKSEGKDKLEKHEGDNKMEKEISTEDGLQSGGGSHDGDVQQKVLESTSQSPSSSSKANPTGGSIKDKEDRDESCSRSSSMSSTKATNEKKEKDKEKENENENENENDGSQRHTSSTKNGALQSIKSSSFEGMEGLELQSMEDATCPCLNSFLSNTFQACCDPLTSEVILYSLMFGIDNIAIYICLFATLDDVEVLVVIIIFYTLLVLYILLALLILYQCPVIAKGISDNAKYLVPFILIGLGIFILSDSIIWGM